MCMLALYVITRSEHFLGVLVARYDLQSSADVAHSFMHVVTQYTDRLPFVAMGNGIHFFHYNDPEGDRRVCAT